MSRRDVIVIGSSAGSLQVLITIMKGLMPDLPAAIFIVMHTSRDNGGALPNILAKAGPLPVAHASQGEKIRQGRIYVAPPDLHMLVELGRITLWYGPRENQFRPAVDPLFRSAARSYHQRVIGVVLSGGMNDGTQGLITIKRHGGIAIVQDPQDAVVPSMPTSAICHAEIDHILTASEIAPALDRLTRERAEPGKSRTRHIHGKQDVSILKKAGLNPKPISAFQEPPSSLTCPECGGALWERHADNLLGYRCHLGHRFTSEILEAEQATRLESALFMALRILQETVALKHKMAERAHAVGMGAMAQGYSKQAADAQEHASLLRQVLLGDNLSDKEPEADAQAFSTNGRKAKANQGKKVASRKPAGKSSPVTQRKNQRKNHRDKKPAPMRLHRLDPSAGARSRIRGK